MSGSKYERIVIDTNVLFMALYNPESKAGEIIQYAQEGKIELFSTDSVKEELKKVLEKEMKLNQNNINLIISSLPVNWVSKPIYEHSLKNTKVKHKPDKPVEALALTLNCRVLSADHHFKDRMNIDKLISKIKENRN